MRKMLRYYLPALLMDMAMYLDLYGMEIKTQALGGSALELAVLSNAYLVVYIALCPLMARITRRTGPDRMMAVSVLLFIGVSLLPPYCDTIYELFGAAAALGGVSSMFWPILQADLGAASEPGSLAGDIGTFNLFWTVGKGIGLTCQGALYELVAPQAPYWVAAAAGGLVAWSMLWARRHATTRAALPAVLETPPQATEKEPSQAAALWPSALVFNFVVWGTNTAIIALFPSLAEPIGIGVEVDGGPIRQGWCLGAMFAGQLLGFWVLRRWTGWAYRFPLMWMTMLGLAVATLGMYLATTWWLLLVPMGLYGLGLSLSYYSSILYSLDHPDDPAFKTSIHEATLAAGAFALPLVAAGASSLTGADRSAYLVLLAVLLAGSLLLVLFRRLNRRRGSGTS